MLIFSDCKKANKRWLGSLIYFKSILFFYLDSSITNMSDVEHYN